MNISIVIPIFNDTAALPELIRRTFQTMDADGYGIELIMVDDGSSSAAWQHMKIIKSEHPKRDITLLKLDKNYGQHAATLCGIIFSTKEYIVTMDSDLQHPPEEIPRLIQHLAEAGRDLVYGIGETGHSPARRVANTLVKELIAPLGHPRVKGSAFRAMKKELSLKIARQAKPPFIILDLILTKETTKIESINIQHRKRKNGTSSYWKSPTFMIMGFVYYSLPSFTFLVLLGLSIIIYVLFNDPSFKSEHINTNTTLALITGSLFPSLGLAAIKIILKEKNKKPFSIEDKII